MGATGRMHSARLEGSPRLRAVLACLEAAGARGATAREIREASGMEAISAIIDELRDNHVAIPRSLKEPREGGRKQYVYRLGKFASGTPSEALQSPVQRTLFGEVG